MANKVLSIEIGSGVTSVAELDYKVKKPKIYHIFTFSTPQGVLENGVVNVNDNFTTRLSSELSKYKIATKRAVFVLNSTRVANRTVQIPNVKENRIAELVRANASDYFPVDLSQYDLSYEVTGKIQDGAEKRLQLSVLAVPRDVIAAYERFAEACGLALVGLDYMGNSIKKLMDREIQEGIKATIKIDEDASVITVVENGTILLQRTVGYGISDAVNSVTESNLFGYYVDTHEALEAMSRKRCIRSGFNADSESAEEGKERDADIDAAKLKQLRNEITEDLRPLIGSISRILDYYQSNNAEKKIEKIYLIGLGSVCAGLSHLMSNELNQKIVATRQFGNIARAKNVNAGTVNMAQFFACIGAAVEPVSIPIGEKKGEKSSSGAGKEDAAKGGSYAVPVLLCGLCVIASIAMIAYSIITSAMLAAENALLTTQISQLEYIEQVVAEYNAAAANDNWALAVKEATESYNDGLVSFIEELEEKMPSEINVLTLSASETSVSLNIEVTSKSAAADVIAQLRTFSSILVGNVSTISDTKDDAGNATVNFSVDCYYLATSDDTDEAEDTESADASEDEDLLAE